MNPTVCRLFIVPALALALAAARPACAEDTSDLVTLSFVNADIAAVVQAMGKITGKNFLLDPRVKGTINIVSAQPVPRDLSYQILLSSLRLQGYTAIENDRVVKIVPEADAKLHAVPTVRGKNAGAGDRLVTQVFHIRNESAAQIVGVLRPMISPNNTIAAYPANNTLVITDYAENIQRLGRIIESIDVPQGDVQVLPIHHASAIDLGATIVRLLGDTAATIPGNGTAGAPTAVPGDGSQRVQIVPDARTNSLLVRSDNPSKIAAVRQLVANLDVPGAGGNFHVVYLKNAEAARVAHTLRALLAGESGNAPGSVPPPAPAAPTSAPAASLSGNPVATIQADTASNALIITAPEPVFNNLRGIIDQLDRRRAQVYVEALIAEVTAERAAEFGIQWNALSGGAVNSSRASVIGGTNFGTGGQNLLNAMTNPTGVGHGLNIMVSKGTLDVLGVKILNLSMLARFLENDTRTNILSTPNLVTLDNEEAKIVIGQNLPFVTGQYTNTGGGTTPANPFQTIERKDVGLTLKIRPQISEGGTIKLTIAQETSSVVQTTAANATGPVTNKRSLDSTVLADDGAIIALGGLVQDAFEGGDEKVPLLGDIPVVGGLFSYNSRKRSKTNLVIFLRPVILRDRDASRDLSADRYDYLIGEQKKQNADARLLRNEPEAPVLLSIDQALGGQGLLPRETPALPTGGQ